MKKAFLFLIISLFAIGASAQDAKKILDKTAAVVGSKSGAQANFSISGGKLNASGTIAIKGNKFCARTAQATMWYDGKTQWTYMAKTNEVNVANPSAAQQQRMNPYSFISLYKKGYNLSAKKQGTGYEVHMKATGKASIPEMYVTVDASYRPTKVRMLQGGNWTTITISNFQAKKLSDATFTFNAKEFPTAEVIDLR